MSLCVLLCSVVLVGGVVCVVFCNDACCAWVVWCILCVVCFVLLCGPVSVMLLLVVLGLSNVAVCCMSFVV